MVPVAPPRLTPIGFRRDIKLFLAALVGFLVVIILALLLLLQSITTSAAEEQTQQWNLASDAATDALSAAGPSRERSVLESQLVFLRGRYGIAGIRVQPQGGDAVLSGDVGPLAGTTVIRRETPLGIVEYTYDAAEIENMKKVFLATSAIAIAATVAASLLLMLYLPRIIRPIEQMLEHAGSVAERGRGVDEAHYLIETFRSSIARLQEQERELKRLHTIEKTRADDLQRITATLTRSLSSGFIALDAEGRIVDVNAAAREILDLPAGVALAGKSTEEALGDNELTRELRRTLEERLTVSRKELMMHRDDQEITIGVTTVPLIGETDTFLGMLALFADLTPVRLLEARVRDMQTLADLGEISAGIAHEFRNSLSAILGYLKLARRNELPPESDSRVRKAEEEAILLARAVESLLNFARPMEPERQRLDLGKVAEEVVERLRSQAPGVTIDSRLDAVWIDGDAALLSRAVENVLRNAIEAVSETGDPRIEVRASAFPSPSLVVRDHGNGVDPREIPRLLLPFQSARPGGMGLGLPLSRKIVLLHGGDLRFSSAPGNGSTVRMDFPPSESV